MSLRWNVLRKLPLDQNRNTGSAHDPPAHVRADGHPRDTLPGLRENGQRTESFRSVCTVADHRTHATAAMNTMPRTRNDHPKTGAPGGCVERLVGKRATDKSVRDAAVTVKLAAGQIVVENKLNGVLFSFPAAVWPGPEQSAYQRMWVQRLTPWWDMEQPQWSPTSQRLRESCVKAINKLFPAAQPPTSPSEVGGRGKIGRCAAVLPGNQSETSGMRPLPNTELRHGAKNPTHEH